jgi:hypothetical protein
MWSKLITRIVQDIEAIKPSFLTSKPYLYRDKDPAPDKDPTDYRTFTVELQGEDEPNFAGNPAWRNSTGYIVIRLHYAKRRSRGKLAKGGMAARGLDDAQEVRDALFDPIFFSDGSNTRLYRPTSSCYQDNDYYYTELTLEASNFKAI